jgi:integrase
VPTSEPWPFTSRPPANYKYERHLRLHVVPYLGDLTLASVTPASIRTWRKDRLVEGVGRSTVAKTYRILHAIFTMAVDDDLVRRNPCRIKGAGFEHTDERPTATLDQVLAIARAIQPRYCLLVLLATFAQLRFGELVALRRNSIDLDTMELRVRKATAEMADGSLVDDDPKSRAGIRPISVPAALRPDIEWQLKQIAQPGSMGRLFIGPQGGIPRRRNFIRIWGQAIKKAGIPTTWISTCTTSATREAPGQRRRERHDAVHVECAIGAATTRVLRRQLHAPRPVRLAAIGALRVRAGSRNENWEQPLGGGSWLRTPAGVRGAGP